MNLNVMLAIFPINVRKYQGRLYSSSLSLETKLNPFLYISALTIESQYLFKKQKFTIKTQKCINLCQYESDLIFSYTKIPIKLELSLFKKS